MKAINAGHGSCPVRSVAAGEIEAAVIGDQGGRPRPPLEADAGVW